MSPLFGKMSRKDFRTEVASIARLAGWRVHVSDSSDGFPDLVMAHPRQGVVVVLTLGSDETAKPNEREWIGLLHGRVWMPETDVIEVLGSGEHLRHGWGYGAMGRYPK